MSLGLIGRKVGMMRLFSADGDAIPVTVIDASGNHVAQIKSVLTDGYCAVQVASGVKRRSNVKKSQVGHFSKASVEVATDVCEFRMLAAELDQLALAAGAEIKVDLFAAGQKLDVSGVTKGKGYAGTIKRYNFRSGRASHGNSRSHNVPGSIGMAQDPGRVFPGKRMTGHMGDVKQTTQNLEVVRVDVARGLVMVRGAVPGAPGGRLILRPSVKGSVKPVNSVGGA